MLDRRFEREHRSFFPLVYKVTPTLRYQDDKDSGAVTMSVNPSTIVVHPFGKTQVMVAGGGQDLLVRIPAGVAHGYRPLTNPCALLYFVTETFDPAAPDELRIPWDHPAVKGLWDVPNG